MRKNNNNKTNSIMNTNSLNINAMNNNTPIRNSREQTNALIQSLAQKAVAGDTTATDKLLNLLYGETLSFLSANLPKDVQKAEDMNQDLWVKVWGLLASGKYSPESGSFKSWVMKVACNMFKDEKRRAKSAPTMVSMSVVDYKTSSNDAYDANPDDCDSEDLCDSAQSYKQNGCDTDSDLCDTDSDLRNDAESLVYGSDPLAQMIDAEDARDRKPMQDELREAINSLPENQQRAIMDYYYSDMSYNEMAEEYGVSLSTALSYCHRGRKSLEKIMNKYGKARA